MWRSNTLDQTPEEEEERPAGVVVDSEPSAVRVAPCDACVLGVYPAIDDEVAQLLAAGPKARTRRALRGGDDHEPRRAASCCQLPPRDSEPLRRLASGDLRQDSSLTVTSLRQDSSLTVTSLDGLHVT